MPCSKQSKQARQAIESSNHRDSEFKGPAAGGEALQLYIKRERESTTTNSEIKEVTLERLVTITSHQYSHRHMYIHK